MKSVKKLQTLNDQAEAARTEDKAIPWELGVDRNKLWLPENLTHLYHLPVYKKLTAEQQRSYNQMFSLLVVEQTVLLEERLSAVLERAFSHPKQRARLKDRFPEEFPAAIDSSIQHFKREEIEHTDMFWRLAHMSDEAYEGKRKYIYFKPNPISFYFTKFVLSIPYFAIFWPWLGLYAEEKFLVIYKEIKRAGDAVDTLHGSVHYVHMLDETRHVQLDEFYIQECWDKAPRWKRVINRWILGNIYKQFVVNSSTSRTLWKHLVKRFPELKPLTGEALAQLKTIGQCESYQHIVSGRPNIPRSSKMFDERPELHVFERVLPAYTCQPAAAVEQHAI